MYRYYRYDAEFKKMTPVTKHATSIIQVSITGVLAERYGRVHMVLIKKRYLCICLPRAIIACGVHMTYIHVVVHYIFYELLTSVTSLQLCHI